MMDMRVVWRRFSFEFYGIFKGLHNTHWAHRQVLGLLGWDKVKGIVWAYLI